LPSEVDDQQRRQVAAEPEEGDVPERHVAGEAADQVPRVAGRDEHGDVGRELEVVARLGLAEERSGGEHRGEKGAVEAETAPAGGAARAVAERADVQLAQPCRPRPLAQRALPGCRPCGRSSMIASMITKGRTFSTFGPR